MPRARLLAIACLTLCVACGSTPDPPGTAASSGSGQLLTSRPGARLVVATVNGIPVYEDCVRHQAAALAVEASAAATPEALRRQAVQECIDFELLAQAAQHQGLLADPEVQEARKRETVRQMIDREVRAALPSADALAPARLREAYATLEPRIHRPELRDLAHFIVVAKDEPEGSPTDREAQALANQLHAALSQVPDLTAEELRRRALELAPAERLAPKDPDGALRIEEFKLYPSYPGIDERFTKAVFAIPEVGQIAPPVRTHEGWHIILLTATYPAVNATPEEARDIVFGYLQNRRYEAAVEPLLTAAEIEVDEQALDRLQGEAEQSRSAAPRSP